MKRNSFLILLASIFFNYCFASVSPAVSEDKNSEDKGRKIVAKVNGKAIYEDQLTPYVDKALKKFKKHGLQQQSPDFLKHQKKKALEEVIAQEILYQAGESITILDVEEKINDKLTVMKNRYPSEEAFEASFKTKNLTKDDLKESVRRGLFIDEYLKKQGLQNPEVPEAGIKEYYEKNKGNFKREEHIRVSHILIKFDENANSEKREEARERAIKIRQEIAEGKDFSEMAKENSGCEKSAKNGGDLGYIEKGYMPPEFDNIAFNLKKGEISAVVQTKYGYHIIKVVDIKPEGLAPYDEVKDLIGKYLQGGIAKEKIASHIAELKEKAKIEIYLN